MAVAEAAWPIIPHCPFRTMTRSCLAALVGTLALAGSTPAAAGQPAGPGAAASHAALLERYCVGCHNDRLRTAGLALDRIDLADVGADPELWEKVVRKLRAGMMPPAGRPRPEQAARDALVAWLQSGLDRAAVRNPNPGRVDSLRRLSRTEYRNAISDLLALDVDVAELLPADDSSGGFDNASLGGLDPGRLEDFLLAARKVSRLALAAPARPTSHTVVVPSDFTQSRHVPGLPFGTRGGVLAAFTFPSSGEYDIDVTLGRDFLQLFARGPAGLSEPHDLVVTLDGELVHTARLQPAPPGGRGAAGGAAAADPYGSAADDASGRPDVSLRLAVDAGRRRLGVAFAAKGARLVEQHLESFERPHVAQGEDQRPEPVVETVEITGPFAATASRPDTASRRRIFSCRPTARAEEADCARTILTTLARRAFRRPVNDSDVDGLLAFYRQGYAAGRASAAGGFEAGIQRALRRLLAHPEFLFRIERDPGGAAGGSPYRISDVELASRLSFFLWSSIPDGELLAAASSGRLRVDARIDSIFSATWVRWCSSTWAWRCSV